MPQLRSYQTDAINQMRSLMQKGCKSILYTAPTGSGKTLLTAHMLHTAASKGMQSLFIVHRRELIKQSARAFDQEGIEYGIISAGFSEDRGRLVQLASIQTLTRRLQRIRAPRLIVWDEAHHLASESWSKTFAAFSESFHIGLTATPERLDGRGLGTFFQTLVSGPSVSRLIEQGYLSPYKLYAPSTVSMEGIHTRMGDYEKRELANAMDKPSITGSAVEHYKRLCYGKRAIIFCASIAHSQHVVGQFQANGIAAHHIDGETPEEERDKTIERFKEGTIQVLSNVEIFGEGFDVPAIEAAILLRPTQSLGYYLQQVGRSLRPAAGKNQAIILDHVGNWSRHGLPDDERVWSLEGQPGRTKQAASQISVKICPKCYAAQSAGLPACKFCGFVFEAQPRTVVEVAGELQEIDRLQARRHQVTTKTLQELIALGRERKYKYPERWAWFVMRGRQAKKMGRVV